MSRNPKIHKPLGATFGDVIAAIVEQGQPLVQMLTARPFLKWVGGKRSILPELLARMPETYDTYNEPFLGGGALFFSVKPQEASLSDINFHLILTFQRVRDDLDGVIRALKIHASRHSPEYYTRARERLFKEKDSTKLAALFIYLNKTCFNGLYRVNRSGQFNVPIGDYKNPPILDEPNLRACSAALQGVEIEQKPFTQIVPLKGDFYYLDPPYHETYEGYSAHGFGDAEHTALAAFCKKINEKGGYFMLSNSDTPFVRKLYAGYTVEHVSAARSVSCKANTRGRENELLIRNYGTKRRASSE